MAETIGRVLAVSNVKQFSLRRLRGKLQLDEREFQKGALTLKAFADKAKDIHIQ